MTQLVKQQNLNWKPIYHKLNFLQTSLYILSMGCPWKWRMKVQGSFVCGMAVDGGFPSEETGKVVRVPNHYGYI